MMNSLNCSVDWLIGLIGFGGFFIRRPKLYTLIVTASNTWGLFLLILLLGHGLVDIPRGFWRASSLSFRLAYTQFKLAKVSSEKAEADEELEDVLGVSSLFFFNPGKFFNDQLINQSIDHSENSSRVCAETFRKFSLFFARNSLLCIFFVHRKSKRRRNTSTQDIPCGPASTWSLANARANFGSVSWSRQSHGPPAQPRRRCPRSGAWWCCTND